MIELAQFGAGRIGQIHARNVAATGEARLKYLVDVDHAAAAELAAAVGAKVTDPDTALADPQVTAVIIASSTDTHAELIEAAARAGKAIFCEKPIDLNLARTRACLKVVEDCGVPLFVGFNRRFDPSFAGLRESLAAGRIGKLEKTRATLVKSQQGYQDEIDEIEKEEAKGGKGGRAPKAAKGKAPPVRPDTKGHGSKGIPMKTSPKSNQGHSYPPHHSN